MSKMKHVIYGDTDSAYCTMKYYMEKHVITPAPESAVSIADEIGEKLNKSLPAFFAEAFLIPEDRGRIAEAGREVVAVRGLFKDKKKRYALHVINTEGKAVDKLKIMGMETRRSDTPRFIQEFLETCLRMLVKEDKSYTELRAFVDEFRDKFRAMPGWTQGSPGRVKKLITNSKKMDTFERKSAEGYVGLKKPTMHYTVKAAANTNKLIEINKEHRWDVIHDGDKVEAIYLKPNEYDMDIVAIKTGETYVPEWFKKLPFDQERMEEKLLDKKLFNVIGDILGWDFRPPTNHSADVFETDDDFYS